VVVVTLGDTAVIAHGLLRGSLPETLPWTSPCNGAVVTVPAPAGTFLLTSTGSTEPA
jgi:hypothetical protein